MADQQIINYGAEPNDGSGDSLRDAFIKVDQNFANLWAAGPVNTNVTIANNSVTVTNTNGNLILNPNGIGVIQTNNHVVPRINGVYNLGSPTVAYKTAYIGTGGIITTGNVTADYFIGDGSQLTNLTVSTGTAIVNGNSNVSVAANANVTVGVAGVANVATFTTTGLEVTGNISGNYVLGNGSQLVSTMTDRGQDPSNWDTTTQMGIYKVNRESWSGVTGAPIDSSVFVGILQVNTSGDATTQLFYPGTVGPPTDVRIQWNRSLWDSTWSEWIRIVNNGQTIDAGTY
jgi:hypothetical protein